MEEYYTCRICMREGFIEDGLHDHLRTHKISRAEYYQIYYPRHDLLTGEIIHYKSKEFYFDNDFNTKENLRNWLLHLSKEEQIAHCKNLLSKRKQQKNLKYSPSQVELRTVMIPAINYLETILDYYKVCEELGFANKYKKITGKLPVYPLEESKRKIIIDSRERTPLHFYNFKTRIEKLDEGDYALEDEDEFGCVIERKSLGDFYGTLASYKNQDRFVRELERAKSKNLGVVVLVESDLNNVYTFKDDPSVNGSVKASGHYVFHIMRDLIQKFQNIQFLFVKNRNTSARVIEALFQSRGEYRNIDLQLAMDKGELI